MTETLNKSVVLFKQNDEAVSIEYFDNKLIFTDGDNNCTSTTIDRNGLLELAKRIKATVKDSEKAEMLGGKIGSKLTDELIKLKGDSAESFSALKKSIIKLAEYDGNYRDEFFGGFCVTFSPLARIGAVNVPKGKCEDADSEALVF